MLANVWCEAISWWISVRNVYIGCCHLATDLSPACCYNHVTCCLRIDTFASLSQDCHNHDTGKVSQTLSAFLSLKETTGPLVEGTECGLSTCSLA